MSLIPLITFILNILILIISIAGFVKVIKNDLIHVQASLKKIEDKVDKLTEEFSYLKGVCEERHCKKRK